MSIRIDASGDVAYRSASLPSYTNFTIMGWAYLVSDRTGNFRFFAGIEDTIPFTDATAWKIIGWHSDNTMYLAAAGGDAGSQNFAASPSDGDWFYFGITANAGNDFLGYWITADGATTQTASRANCTGATAGSLSLGNDTYDEWNNIRVANILVYDAVLTQAQIERQQFVYRPIIYTNLHAWYPMFGGSSERLRDYSGNGKVLTAGGTLSDEANPAITWGLYPPPATFVVAAATPSGGVFPSPRNHPQRNLLLRL